MAGCRRDVWQSCCGDASAGGQPALPAAASVACPLLHCFACMPACLPPLAMYAPGDTCREGHDTSPLTNERLQHKMLMECSAMRRCVDEVLQYVASVRRQVL